MSFDFSVRNKTFLMALPTGIFYLARNRYTSMSTALAVVSSVGMPILYGLIFIPLSIELTTLVILIVAPLSLYCFSYLAQVYKVEFPDVYAKGSDWRWFFESCLFLFFALGSYGTVNFELIRDLLVTHQFLQGWAWMGGVLSLLPFIGVVLFRARQLIGDISKN